MQKPLRPEAQIGLLGGTLETAVIIKVPSVAGSPKRKRPSDDVDPKAAKHTKADVPISTVKENKFRQLFSNNQCIGGSFETQRALTVEKFYRLLFPDDGSLGLPVISVRAPPMSGKRGMCCLLNNYIVANNPQVLVAHIAASYMLDSDTDKFTACFERQFGGSFTQFSSLSREKVVLIDEAEMAYRDAQLWAGIAKSVIDGSIPRMRIVLFSSYGSFNNFICENRTRSGVDIRPEYRFGLRGTAVKPGLELTREELKEMVGGGMKAEAVDVIWSMCGGHIGLAHATLRFLRLRLGHALHTIDASSLSVELHSKDLLVHLGSLKRGMPTPEAVTSMAKFTGLSEAKVAGILNEVALSHTVLANDMNMEKGHLTRSGFLYEDENRHLQFASDVHMTLWLNSSQKH